jgi:predicted ATPase
MSINDDERALLCEVLAYLVRRGGFPEVTDFRLNHAGRLQLIDALVSSRHLRNDRGRYALTLEGLRACDSLEARQEITACNSLLPVLEESYLAAPGKTWTVEELAKKARRDESEVARSLTFLIERNIHSVVDWDSSTGLVKGVRFAEGLLDVKQIDWQSGGAQAENEPPEQSTIRLHSIEIHGYRPFAQFRAHPGALTVIIGANASGKSSLFDFLRFVSFAASNPLPPEIEPASAGKTLFHVGGPERIKFALVVDRGQHAPLRYEVEVQGPVGSVKILHERLASAVPIAQGARGPFIFLEFRDGKGVVRDPVERDRERLAWTLPPNELALRRALDPTLVTLSNFQGFLSSWRFYSGFKIASNGALRRPVPTEPEPILAEDGSNLSAVLFSLMTEHDDAWQELETHLGSAIPGFQSLRVKPRGGMGTVIGVWRELGVEGELTLADLSDGTLRLLCWATLCLAPSIPPLVCIDEPELGLHPRVLPVLAGLLRIASTRSQILVATHSPFLLAQFSLSEIAVMRKEDGHAVFVRLDTSAALQREIEELGGEALAQMHISDELEVRA